MRILAVPDLHYTLRQLDWVVQMAEKMDVVILGGDELDVASAVPLEGQIAIITRYVDALAQQATVLVGSGNHDLDRCGPHGEKEAGWMDRLRDAQVHVDGDAPMIGDVLFSVCPWWDGTRSRDLVEAQLVRDAERRAGRWIWVYHSPPEGALSWTGQKHFGDDAVKRWIDRFAPDIVFSGHIHQAPFTDEGSWVERVGATWVFNPGRQPGEIPTHVIVEDTEAFWWSPYGAQTLDLQDPSAIPVDA